MLEIVLFALPRRDTKPLARALLTRFGSFAASIAAPNQDLLAVEGLGDAGVAALKSVHAAALRLLRAEVIDRPVLTNWPRLMEYLTAELSRETHRAVPCAVPRQPQPAAGGRGAAARHGEPHPCLPARGRQARAGTACHGADPGSQPSEWRPDPVRGRHRHDAADQSGRRGRCPSWCTTTSLSATVVG